MAKEIKAIKCPQCGSSQKTGLKENFFRCNSCGTEYFLDDDDVNVNVRYQNVIPPPPPRLRMNDVPSFDIKRFFIVLAVGLFVLLIVMSIGIRSCISNNSSGYSSSASMTHYDSRAEDCPINSAGKGYIFVLAERSYYGSNDKKEVLYYFIDVASGKASDAVTIKSLDQISDHSYQRFSNGRDYFIINKKQLWELDEATKKFTDVTSTLLSVSGLDSGIASLRFSGDRDSDGLDIMNNVGEEFYYYPIPKLLIKSADRSDASAGFKNLLPGAHDSTYYTFSEVPTITYSVKRIPQLLKVTYKYNAGGPANVNLRPSWDRDYWESEAGAQVIGGNRYVMFYKNSNRVSDWKDITPDRLYFSPKVVYADNQGNLVIKFRSTAAEDSDVNIQRIDPATGKPLWTQSLTKVADDYSSNWYYGRSALADGRYILKCNYNSYIVINTDGTGYKMLNLK